MKEAGRRENDCVNPEEIMPGAFTELKCRTAGSQWVEGVVRDGAGQG